MSLKIARWLVVFPFRIFDLITMVGSLVYLPYFWFKVRGKWGTPGLQPKPLISVDELILLGSHSPVSEHGFMLPESHTLLANAGNCFFHPKRAEKLLEKVLYPSGYLYRKYPEDETIGASGDCISSWTHAYVLSGAKRPDLVKKLAWHFLKNCFGLYWEAKGGVTDRANTCGVNFCIDAWPYQKLGFGFSSPSTGGTFFTAQALFTLAAREVGGLWKLVSILHWWLFCGWFWYFIPALYFKSDPLYYTQHIIGINLWTLNKLTGWYKFPMKWVTKWIAPGGNIHPILGALAWNMGCLSKKDAEQALGLARSSYHCWPQHPPTDASFFSYDPRYPETSLYAMAAFLLSQPPKYDPRGV